MEAETGVHQETISRYDAERRANADKVLLRSAPPVARGQPLSYRFFVSPAGLGFEDQSEVLPDQDLRCRSTLTMRTWGLMRTSTPKSETKRTQLLPILRITSIGPWNLVPRSRSEPVNEFETPGGWGLLSDVG
jgi:hypothetical protein